MCECLDALRQCSSPSARRLPRKARASWAAFSGVRAGWLPAGQCIRALVCSATPPPLWAAPSGEWAWGAERVVCTVVGRRRVCVSPLWPRVYGGACVGLRLCALARGASRALKRGREGLCERVAYDEYRGVPASWEEASRRAGQLVRRSSGRCACFLPVRGECVRALLIERCFTLPPNPLLGVVFLRPLRAEEHTFGEPSRGGVGVRRRALRALFGVRAVRAAGRAPALESECRSLLVPRCARSRAWCGPIRSGYLVDPASSHMLVSKIKPCMSKYKRLYCETANGSLNQLWFI